MLYPFGIQEIKVKFEAIDVERRRPVWCAISELWVDQELDVASIARTLIESGYSKEEINQIYAFEVSPVVWKNFGFS